MRVVGILLILLISFSCDTENSFPVPEENYFVKFYGEEGNQEGVDFIINTDGSVVMVGNSWIKEDQSDQLIYAVKVDAQGVQQWQHYYGTTLPGTKTARDIELHPDGRIIIVGEYMKGPSDNDIYLFTLDPNGILQDSVISNLDKNGAETDEHANSVSIISDGFIVAGSTTKTEVTNDPLIDIRDALTLRYDNSLNEIPETGAAITWGPRNYGFNSDDVAIKVLETSANNFYVFGYSNVIDPPNHNGDYNFWVYELGGDGIPANAALYIGKTSEDEELTSVEISPIQSGSGYILSGRATRSTGETQSYVVKLSSTLTFQPTDIIIETNPTEMGTDVTGNLATKSLVTEAFILLSNDNTFPNQASNLALTKLTRELTKSWSVPLLFGGEGDDLAGSVAELPNGKILVVGTMTIGGLNGQKKMVLMKLNSEGKLTE